VRELQALSVGPAVDVDASAVGRVHSIFSRAVNVEVRGGLWTLLAAPGIEMPFGIVVDTQDFEAADVRRASAVYVRAGFVGIETGRERLVVDCRCAPRWRRVFDGTPAAGLQERLESVKDLAHERAWHASWAMAQAVTSALYDPAALAGVLPQVVGRGAGTTPAGDDVLAGVLAVLLSPYSGHAGRAAAGRLRRLLPPLLPSTTDLSAHLLRQAADGWTSRPVHELIGALVRDSGRAGLTLAVQRVVATGATSGADTCMGVIAAASAFLAANVERAAA
jgi:hypothetical protein